MTVRTNIDLDQAAVREILNGGCGVREVVQGMIDDIHEAAGGNEAGYRREIDQGSDRIRGSVWTGTWAARKDEADNRTLTRSMDAGRR